jgi:tetratricopeptide (TPR) repeat protein
MGGVCTHQLADCVLLFCGASKQSIDGTENVLRGIKRAEKIREKPIETLIIPARVELAESTFLNAFKEKFLRTFSDFQPKILKSVYDSAWQIRIPYITKYAFEEKLAIRERYQAIAEDISNTFENIAYLLTKVSSTSLREKIRLVEPRGNLNLGITEQSKPRFGYGNVYLSSTYMDLIEHRKAAHDALEQLGLRVIWMEAFGTQPEDGVRVPLQEIENADFFIGIYAHRYGYVPKESDISVVEQEFDYARELGKPIFGFIVNEEHAWSPKYIEFDKKDKLDTFLSKVKQLPVEFFTTPDNLANNVASSIGHYLSDQKTTTNYQSPISSRGSTLPSQPYFFGRAKELEIIRSALSPESRTWGALIDGPGGIGKTALAIKAAHDAPIELFERKIFITAKARELTSSGEVKMTDFTRPTYLSVLEELSKELGEDGIPRLAPDERPNALRIALVGKKALIIFDNLETLPEDERTRLYQFLSRLPEGNKAIVTSRRRTDVDARIVRLDRLARDEALGLIAELAAKYPRLARASQKEREDLYEITQGNPLFIRWITGQLGRAGSQSRTIAEACAFIDKAPKGNDPLEYIFGDLLETFTADETKVLAALTYFSLPAKLKWLADMTDLPVRAAETTLEDLTDRSILTSDLSAQTYFLAPLTAKFIRTRRPEAVTQTGDALTNRAYALALQYGGNTNYEGFRTLDAEWDFISAALPRLLTGDNIRLQKVCAQIETFLNFTGRWDDLLWLSEQAEARAIDADDKEKAGWRAYQAGVTYNLRNQPTEVLTCAVRTAEHWQDSTPRNKALAIRLRGLGYELQKDFSSAINAYREALDINRSISPESIDIAIGLSNLANIELANKDYSSAEHNYREALHIAKKINYQEGVAIMTGNLATLALDREQWAEAESLAREALALAEKIGRQELIAGDCHRLAEALLKQNVGQIANLPLQEAQSLSRRAVEIYTRLRHPELQSAQETLEEIERAVTSG